MNTIRKFDANVAQMLGEYVYALRDPRDNKVFYVGKGTGDRLFAHFNAAEKAKNNNGTWSSKLRRIVEIWEADEDVDWFIVRRDLEQQATVFDVEAAIIDALDISQNGPALNEIGGQSRIRGMLSAEDIAALAAPAVEPKNVYQTVFIFPIHKALIKGRSPYDATRSWWSVSQPLRSANNALAVGVANGLSQGVFSISNWNPAQAAGKWEFDGTQLSNHDLDGKNWLSVISAAKGYWQRGNYLVVEFDGQGKFRFVRGSADKTTWHPL